MKKYYVLAFTENAKMQFEKLVNSFGNEATVRLIEIGEIGSLWDEADAFIFVCAAGIAVRHIAPFLKDKLTDPGVIVMDELGGNVIPILSGHVGGANELARQIEKKLGIRAVITTATDINGTIAIDEWAKKNELIINDKSKIKNVSMKLLRGEEVNIFCASDVIVSNRLDDKDSCDLWLSPQRQLVVGIGCRKDTPYKKLDDFLKETLKDNEIETEEITAFASIDLKMEEEGLLNLSDELDIPIYFYSAEELKCVPGEFDSSEFVEKVTGVSDVSARAAKCCGKNGRFLLKKKKSDGMTISIFEIYRVIKISNEKD